jgi:streptogramin lyase
MNDKKIGTFRFPVRLAVLTLALAFGAPAIAASATIKETPLALGAQPLGITPGPDGNVWFVESNADKIGRIESDGTLTELTIPLPGGFPNQIMSAGGLLYFNDPGNAKLGLVHPWSLTLIVGGDTFAGMSLGMVLSSQIYVTTGGPDFPFGFAPSLSGGGPGCTDSDGQTHNFVTVASDPYGWFWFTDSGSNAIVKHLPAGCFFQTIALPHAASGPKFVTIGPDGNPWFTEYDGDRIGRVNVTAGTITEFPLAAGSHPQMIATAPDGTLWFAESGTNKIGHITVNGTITEYTVPTPNSHPYGVSIGADGSVWFTEEYSAKIGHLMVHPPGDVNGDGLVNVADVFYTINFLFAGGPEPK